MSNDKRNADSKALRFAARFVVLTLTVVILYWASAVFIPVALAILIAFILCPFLTRLERLGIPRIPAVIIIVGVAGLLGTALLTLVTFQLHRLATDLPRYQDNIRNKVALFRENKGGSVIDRVKSLFEQSIGNPKPGSEDPEDAAVSRSSVSEPLEVRIVAEDESKQVFASALASLAAVTPALEASATGALVLVLVIFMLLQREDLRNRLVSLLGETDLATTTKGLIDAGQRISRYLVMQLIINATFGAAVGVGLLLLRVPYAPLWGLCAAVLRYVPYVGPWIAALLPLLVSVIASPNWTQFLLVLALFLVLELVINNVMEPWLYGQGVGISMVALIVAAVFWTWIWGAVGLVLATPLTVCLVVIGKYVPALSFLDRLLGDRPALKPHVVYFQRLLAEDKHEAALVVQKYRTESPPAAVYDGLFIPALILARQARSRGTITVSEESFVLTTTQRIVEGLQADRKTFPLEATAQNSVRRSIISQTVADVVDSDPLVSPAPTEENTALRELASSLVAQREADDVVSKTRPVQKVLGCAAHHESDELTLQMLANLLSPVHIELVVQSMRSLPSDVVERVRREKPSVVVIAALPPGGLIQTRYLCKLLRKQFPELGIVVGCWGYRGSLDRTITKLRAVGAHYITTTLVGAADHVVSLSSRSASE